MRWVLGIVGMLVIASGALQLMIAHTSDIKIYAILVILAGIVLFCTAVILTGLDELQRCIRAYSFRPHVDETREPIL